MKSVVAKAVHLEPEVTRDFGREFDRRPLSYRDGITSMADLPGDGLPLGTDLHPPGDEDQPDHPREIQDVSRFDRDRFRPRETLGANNPALYQISHAGKADQAA